METLRAWWTGAGVDITQNCGQFEEQTLLFHHPDHSIHYVEPVARYRHSYSDWGTPKSWTRPLSSSLANHNMDRNRKLNHNKGGREPLRPAGEKSHYGSPSTSHYNKADKKPRGFVRLDSLDSDLSSDAPPFPHSSTVPAEMNRIARNFHYQGSRSNAEDSDISSQPNQHRSKSDPMKRHSLSFPPDNPKVVGFQTPLNLNTGKRELWAGYQHHERGAESGFLNHYSNMEGHRNSHRQDHINPDAAVIMHHQQSFIAYPNTFPFTSACFNLVDSTLGLMNSAVSAFSSSVMTNLNPNAKAFTPPLNPNAQEFRPSSSIVKRGQEDDDIDMTEKMSDETSCSAMSQQAASATPAHKNERNKKVSEHKVTPFVSVASSKLSDKPVEKCSNSEKRTRVNSEEESSKSADQESILPKPSADESLTSQNRSQEKRQGLDFSDTDQFSPGLSVGPNESANNSTNSFFSDTQTERKRRSTDRSISCSSSDSSSSFIAFSTPNEDINNSSSSSIGNPNSFTKSFKCHLGRQDLLQRNHLFVAAGSDSDSDSDDEDEDDDDDEDWDVVDDASGVICASPDDMPDEFKNCGLFCPIQASMMSKKEPETKLSNGNGNNFDFNDEEESAEGKSEFPGKKKIDSDEMRRKLREINEQWDNLFISNNINGNKKDCRYTSNNKNSSSNKKQIKTSKVQFSDPKSWVEIFEDSDIADELRDSRIGDFATKKADKERMERLLRPILSHEHRKKVFQRLYGNDWKK